MNRATPTLRFPRCSPASGAWLVLWAASLLGHPAVAATATSTDTATTAPQPRQPRQPRLTSTSTSPTKQGAPVRFFGNVLFNEFVYRSLLPESVWQAPLAARRDAIKERIQSFLVDAGYVLAKVVVVSAGEEIHVHVDEGKLDKIIFVRQGSFRMLQLRLELILPGKVFNRPLLEQQMDQIMADRGYLHADYEVVPLDAVPHVGPQLPDFDTPGFDLIPEARRHELRVFFERSEWNRGLRLDAKLNSPDGLELGVKYRGSRLLFGDDRWEARSAISARIQDLVSDGNERRFISGGALQFAYFTPPLFGTNLRPLLWLPVQYISRQRIDLRIRNWDLLVTDPSVRLSYMLDDNLILSAGGGVEYRYLLGVDEWSDPEPRVEPQAGIRPFIAGRIEFEIDTLNQRADQSHFLDFEFRHYMPAGARRTFTRLQYEYQKVISFGFDELRVGSEGYAGFGRVAFVDEVRVADYVRGVSGDRLYSKRIVGAEVQYRMSLLRDLYKVSLQADGAMFAYPEAPGERSRLVGAFSLGAGLHALIIDSFQASVYFAAGFLSFGGNDQTLTLSIKQAF